MEPTTESKAAREAFLASYAREKKKNRFTKVQMDLEADAVLQKYFSDHHEKIQKWLTIISPTAGDLATLRNQLATLRGKNWNHVHD